MNGPAIAAAIAARQSDIVARCREMSDAELRAPSHLPGWDRLTVLCHIRYGGEAIDRMIRAALRDEPALFYPEGRLEQRPGTLLPRVGESPQDVVASFADASAELDATLAALAEDDWDTEFREPDGTLDLGPQTVEQLATLRLTEVDVHSVDLDIGIAEWSDAFVDAGLPLRFERLATRLANQPPIDFAYQGTWLLRTDEGDAWSVTLDGEYSLVRATTYDARSRATITASRRDLLALLLGRPLLTEAVYAGDTEFAAAFLEAFPGP